MVLLEVSNVFKHFSGLNVLSGISVEILEGERHAIIGPNGAGKSTLFNIITGLYKPSKGRIFFRGKDIAGWPVHKIARLGLSRSFQIINIFPKMTVYENVRNTIVSKFNRRFNWVTLLDRDEEVKRETNRFVDIFGISDIRNVPAWELSYGRQRYLELALCLARDPILIMLDEPTAGLNTEETKETIQLIRKITEGKALLIIEHDMEVVFNIADRITVLNDGHILAMGTPNEIRENEEVKNVYIGRR